MSCCIRKNVGDNPEHFLELGPDEWNLAAQVELLADWLRENDGTLESADGWIADIGFTVRVDATGGGPVVSLEIMELCLRNRVEIYLSEYGLENGK